MSRLCKLRVGQTAGRERDQARRYRTVLSMRVRAQTFAASMIPSMFAVSKVERLPCKSGTSIPACIAIL